MRSANNIIDSVLGVVLVVLMTGMIVSIGLNVFFRYVINHPLAWGDEAARTFFVWVAFLGAYGAMRRRTHIKVDVLVEMLPQGIRVPVMGIGVLITSIFLGVVTFYSMRLVLHVINVQEVMPATGLPMAYAYLAIPLGSFLMLIEVLAQAGRKAFWRQNT